jgi:hypothetical protein
MAVYHFTFTFSVISPEHRQYKWEMESSLEIHINFIISVSHFNLIPNVSFGV